MTAPTIERKTRQTAGALVDLAMATADGKFDDHPLIKQDGGYVAAEGRFVISKARPATALVRWVVKDTKSGKELPAPTWEACRYLVNEVMHTPQRRK